MRCFQGDQEMKHSKKYKIDKYKINFRYFGTRCKISDIR